MPSFRPPGFWEVASNEKGCSVNVWNSDCKLGQGREYYVI